MPDIDAAKQSSIMAAEFKGFFIFFIQSDNFFVRRQHVVVIQRKIIINGQHLNCIPYVPQSITSSHHRGI
jgi:hypothetical protein